MAERSKAGKHPGPAGRGGLLQEDSPSSVLPGPFPACRPRPAACRTAPQNTPPAQLTAVCRREPCSCPCHGRSRPKKPCRRTHRLLDRGSGDIHCCPAGNVPNRCSAIYRPPLPHRLCNAAPGCTKAAAVHTVLPGSVSASEDSACRGLTPLRTRSQQICHTSKAERSPPGEQHAGQRTACRLSLWRVWQCVFI